tara:strand:- start:260 stop:730 length:471 start_codon:yes stop_codon:yes gene_type:complete
MATIVVETGSGSSTANSYISESELATYASDRGVTLTGTPSVLIIQAMDYLESRNFIGTKSTLAQSLQWPRTGVEIDNYYIVSNSIPVLLKEAEMELCIALDGGVNPLANQDRETRKEKVGELEVEYAPSAAAITYLTAVQAKLKKLVLPTARIVRV